MRARIRKPSYRRNNSHRFDIEANQVLTLSTRCERPDGLGLDQARALTD